MRGLTKKQVMTLLLYSCLSTGLLVARTGEATVIQSVDEPQTTETVEFKGQEAIPSYLAQAEQFLKVGQFRTVQDMSERVLALRSDNIQARALLAAAFTGLGNQDRAKQEIDAIRKSEPGYSSLYKYQAEAYMASHELDLAEQQYKEGIKKSADKADLMLGLAGLYARQGKLDAAALVFKQVLDLPRLTTQNYLNAGFALCRIDLDRKKYDDVIKRARQIIKKYPPISQGYSFLAMAYQKTGKPEKAVEVYKQLMQANTKIAMPLQEIALLLVDEIQNIDKALVYAQEAVDKFPGDAKSHDVLGWVLLKKNDLAEARKQFATAVHLSPDQPVFLYHLGLLDLKSGHRKEAKKSFSRALVLVERQGNKVFADELTRKIQECEGQQTSDEGK